MERYDKVFQPFSGDGRELFDTGLKYLNKLIENTWRTKIFKSNIFVIHKVLPNFMKILSYEYLEPYGRRYTDPKVCASFNFCYGFKIAKLTKLKDLQ